jgi:hypothetical protein
MRVHTLLIIATVATAAFSAIGCPVIGTNFFAELTGLGNGVRELAHTLSPQFMYLSIACSLLASLAAVSSTDLVPAWYWCLFILAMGLSVCLWAVSLSFSQSLQ